MSVMIRVTPPAYDVQALRVFSGPVSVQAYVEFGATPDSDFIVDIRPYGHAAGILGRLVQQLVDRGLVQVEDLPELVGRSDDVVPHYV